VTITGGGGSAEIDQQLSFSGTFTDPGADEHTILWDFGDGITMTGILTVDHTFESAGTFVVTLSVTDDEGDVGTDQVQVVVQSAVIYMPAILGGGSGSVVTPTANQNPLNSLESMHLTATIQLARFIWHEALLPNGRKLWQLA
jgi:PKD repeat protein